MSIIITDSILKIERNINKAVIQEMSPRFKALAKIIELELRQHIKFFVGNSPEFISIAAGELKKEFGIPDPEVGQKLTGILNVLADSVKVRYEQLRIVGKDIVGGLEVYAIQSDFQDLFSTDYGTVVTEKGQRLNWLEWLLTEGDRIIISNYVIRFGNYAQSRGGGAIMVATSGGSWRVPPQFSGTLQNNWITRTFDSAAKNIETLILNSFKRNL